MFQLLCVLQNYILGEIPQIGKTYSPVKDPLN